jgi:hypothetical protein
MPQKLDTVSRCGNNDNNNDNDNNLNDLSRNALFSHQVRDLEANLALPYGPDARDY